MMDNNFDKTEKIKHSFEKTDENENYIFGNMILGFKEIPFKSLVLFGIDEINNCFVLSYMLDNKEFRINFSYDSILKIEYKAEPIIKYKDVKTIKYGDKYDYSVPPISYGSSNIKHFRKEEIPYEYKKVDIKTIYKIEMTIIYNDEEKEIILNTIKNPEILINKIKEKM